MRERERERRMGEGRKVSESSRVKATRGSTNSSAFPVFAPINLGEYLLALPTRSPAEQQLTSLRVHALQLAPPRSPRPEL